MCSQSVSFRTVLQEATLAATHVTVTCYGSDQNDCMVVGANWIMKAERKTKNQNSTSLERVFPLKTDWIYLILILAPKLVLTKYILGLWGEGS